MLIKMVAQYVTLIHHQSSLILEQNARAKSYKTEKNPYINEGWIKTPLKVETSNNNIQIPSFENLTVLP